MTESIYTISTDTCSTTDTVSTKIGEEDESTSQSFKSWTRKRAQKIFRKKTLYKRLPCLQWIPQYRPADFLPDLIAGITVGITVIPQGLAYSTVAGLPTEYGLYAGFMGCFIYVVLGSTHAVNIGPSTLMALLTYDVTKTLGPSGAILMAFLSGCVISLLGVLNLGFLVDFVSSPVISGFATAAAITTATTQVKSIFGLSIKADGFLWEWIEIFKHIHEARIWDTVMGIGSLVVLLLLWLLDKVRLGQKGHRTLAQKVGNKFLWALSVSRNAVVLLICSVVGAIVSTDMATLEDPPLILTGNVSSGLPPFKVPDFSFTFGNETFTFGEVCKELGSSIVTFPLVSILEAVAIAKSFSKSRKFDPSQEMIAIGVTNILGSFVGSFPVTGSFSRTAVNVASGVRTPLNGIYTGALVLLATSILTPYFYFIPKSCLGAVIIMAVVSMIDIHLVPAIWRTRKLDLIPLFLTVISCLFLSLEYGILIGAAGSLAFVLYSSGRPRISSVLQEGLYADYLHIRTDRGLPFTAIDYYVTRVRKAVLKQQVQQKVSRNLVVVLDFTNVVTADYATASGLKQIADELEANGHKIVLQGICREVYRVLQGSGKEFTTCQSEGDFVLLFSAISGHNYKLI